MKKTGAQTNGVETSPAWKKRRAKARRREEKAWAAKSGPVTIRWTEPKDSNA